MLTFGSLFAGIGGFDLGLERAGMRCLWQVEKDRHARRVLAHNWPDVIRHWDVHAVGAHNLARVDVVCGGFPCQPVSLAGKRLAQADERWLWPEFARIVGELRPRFVLIENVPGWLSAGLRDVLADLASLGFDAEWSPVSACSMGAPHTRERLFVVAYAHGERCPQFDTATQPGGAGWDGRAFVAAGDHWRSEPQPIPVADGFPGRVAAVKAAGNAVVPQVGEWVGRLIIPQTQS